MAPAQHHQSPVHKFIMLAVVQVELIVLMVLLLLVVGLVLLVRQIPVVAVQIREASGLLVVVV